MPAAEVGYYDERCAPFIRAHLLGPQGKAVEAKLVIDTGVNCGLILFKDQAILAHWPETKRIGTLTLANGDEIEGYWSWGYMKWLGKPKYVEAWVIERSNKSRHEKQRTEGGYIGIEFLKGTNISFGTKTIEISSLHDDV